MQEREKSVHSVNRCESGRVRHKAAGHLARRCCCPLEYRYWYRRLCSHPIVVYTAVPVGENRKKIAFLFVQTTIRVNALSSCMLSRIVPDPVLPVPRARPKLCCFAPASLYVGRVF